MYITNTLEIVLQWLIGSGVSSICPKCGAYRTEAATPPGSAYELEMGGNKRVAPGAPGEKRPDACSVCD